MTNTQFNLKELYGNNYDKRSVRDRLRVVGVIVSPDYLGSDKCNRMMLDELGNKIGYYTPLKAIKHFKA